MPPPAGADQQAPACPDLLRRMYARTETLHQTLQAQLPASTLASLRQTGDSKGFTYLLDCCIVAHDTCCQGALEHDGAGRALHSSQTNVIQVGTTLPSRMRHHRAVAPWAAMRLTRCRLLLLYLPTAQQLIEQLFATSPKQVPGHVLALGHCRPRYGGTR